MISINNADDLFLLLRKNHFFERFGLKKIGLFGSMARGEKFKDIDLLIEEDLDYKELLELRTQLEAQTGYKVDIVQKNMQNLLFY